MKNMFRISLIFAGLLIYCNVSVAQVKKYVCLEQFTQASCGPCAAWNPGFNSSILQGQNQSNIHHIAYHVFWPGVDPMFDENPTQINDRINYYNVSGVPELYMQGTTWTGSPLTISNSVIYNESVSSSPIGVTVKEITNGNIRNVKVKVFFYGNLPQGNYILRTAVVENPVTYLYAPGSNGEKVFPGVFRKMLPGTGGEILSIPNIGDSLEFNYTYTLQSNWKAAKVSCIAFVENDDTKIILNSGATNDPPLSFVKPKAKFSVLNNKGCAGKYIQFFDESTNFPNARTWSFSGGTPSSSTQKNPLIRYDSTGTFDVSLRVNGYGGTKDSLKLTGYVSVGIPGISPLVPESFEPVSFPPSGWNILNPDNSKTWARTNLAKKSGSASSYINNYEYASAGQTDEMISISYNLSSISNPSLYFQLAYTNLSIYEVTDTLEVLISDCGDNYISIYKKWGDELRTTAPSGYSFFPADNEWSKQVIDLSAYAGSENTRIKFRQISAAQNNLFLDDIQVLNATGIKDAERDRDAVQLFPNPCKGILHVQAYGNAVSGIKIYDLSGKMVYQAEELREAENTSVLDIHSLENGIYSVDIISGDSHRLKKLVLLK